MSKINLYISKGFVAITILFTLTSCQDSTENWGYISKDAKIEELKLNSSTREEVFEKLGSPTSKSVYGDEKWFYIGTEVTKETFYTPNVVNHNVYTISFNELGVVTNIDKKNKDAKQDISITEDKTVTEGNEITITQQFLGNLGKFNKEGMLGGRKNDASSTRLPRY